MRKYAARYLRSGPRRRISRGRNVPKRGRECLNRGMVNTLGVRLPGKHGGRLRGTVYLEYAGDEGVIMLVLLLVELVQVVRVVLLTVSGHLLPHLGLLPCLEGNATHT